MFKLVVRVVVRKAKIGIHLGRRRSICILVLATFLLVWYSCGWLITITSKALLPPPPPDQNLDHFRRNRSLAHYMDNIQVLIEPSTTPCAGAEEVPVLILVSSAPLNYENRQAVRTTWGKHQPTYFVMGLNSNDVDEQLVDNYVESKQYGDLVLFELHDHYQNLTLKSALMIQWALRNCPQAEFMFKTDDDVLVNPWTLKLVLKENPDAALLGYKIEDTLVHRDEYTKWFMPRWLFNTDVVPQYLSGTGYLINGVNLENILKKAYKVPLVNLEDVYFTYLVAHRTLSLPLTHDRRLSPHKPWLPLACAYWTLASMHSLSPDEMATAWSKIENIADLDASCSFFKSYLESDFLLY
ncbi:unnamed protein product [Arctia plantaginis]|uniref:Hexosyltransferase n=1 Tax=Arctia plantaginis TaxID=874455 RepID=A0A8S0ZE55_ARCPL|nr:unnamed protein product [Arctia plantaginis]